MIDEQLRAPVLLLSTDITVEIFKQAIWVDVDGLDSVIGSHLLVTPLTLGAVCSSWRALVWDTPSLWTIITLKLTNEARHRDTRNILDLWLRKSASYPLELYFYVRTNDWPAWNQEQLEEDASVNVASRAIIMLRKLVEHSPRWRKINLRIFEPVSELVEVLHQVKGRVPLLETGCLCLNDAGGTMLDMFEDAPLLNGFAVHYWSINCIMLPWKQLTSFRADVIVEEECIAILSQCTNLIECAFSDVIRSEDEDVPNPMSNSTTIFLSQLRSLSITNTNVGSIEIILECAQFRFPELRQLVLSNDHSSLDQFPSLQPVEDFITRSDCALEALTLDGVAELWLVLPILERLPSLQYLALQDMWSYHMDEFALCEHEDTDSFFNAFLTKLDLTNTPTIFLPNLTGLECKIPLPTSFPPLHTSSNLLKILQQRWCPPEGVSKLQKLIVQDTFKLSETQDRDVIDGLRELVRQGMKILVPGL